MNRLVDSRVGVMKSAVLVLGLCTLGFAQIASAQRGREMVMDGRYHHDHYYPSRGVYVRTLPRGYRSVVYGPDRFFFSGGVWYRPYGPRFVVVAPPFGLAVPFLPDFYTTVWFGGVPYYYANDTYYLWNRDTRAYVVTQAPGDPAAGVPAAGVPAAGDPQAYGGSAPGTGAGDDFFMYPRNSQSTEQQAKDRFECHQWAATQTGFDPSEPGGGVSPAQNGSKRSDYRRAITACLEGRQYSVK